MADLTVAEHRTRASEHEKLGLTLLDVKQEWAAVSLFYSAYHHAKAALLEDPIFDDLSALQAANRRLTLDDRTVSMHKARKGSPHIGLNDLVLILYRPVAASYHKLHQMSVDVRYQHGLRPGAIEDLPRVHSDFSTAVQQGVLRYGA